MAPRDSIQAAITDAWERVAPQIPDVAHRLVVPCGAEYGTRAVFERSALALPFVEAVEPDAARIEVGPGVWLGGYGVLCKAWNVMAQKGAY